MVAKKTLTKTKAKAKTPTKKAVALKAEKKVQMKKVASKASKKTGAKVPLIFVAHAGTHSVLMASPISTLQAKTPTKAKNVTAKLASKSGKKSAVKIFFSDAEKVRAVPATSPTPGSLHGSGHNQTLTCGIPRYLHTSYTRIC